MSDYRYNCKCYGRCESKKKVYVGHFRDYGVWRGYKSEQAEENSFWLLVLVFLVVGGAPA